MKVTAQVVQSDPGWGIDVNINYPADDGSRQVIAFKKAMIVDVVVDIPFEAKRTIDTVTRLKGPAGSCEFRIHHGDTTYFHIFHGPGTIELVPFNRPKEDRTI